MRGAGGPAVPEVSSEDSSSKSKNAITREKSRSVELGRKEYPTWRVTGYSEVIKLGRLTR